MRKKKYWYSIIAALLLLSLCSCGLQDSYKKFQAKGFEDFDSSNSASCNAIKNAPANEVILIPEIYQWDYEMGTLYLSAYAKEQPQKYRIKGITLSQGNDLIVAKQLHQGVMFNRNNGLSEGIAWTTFEYDFEAAPSEPPLILTVIFETTDQSGIRREKQTCEIEIIQYQSLFLPLRGW